MPKHNLQSNSNNTFWTLPAQTNSGQTVTINGSAGPIPANAYYGSSQGAAGGGPAWVLTGGGGALGAGGAGGAGITVNTVNFDNLLNPNVKKYEVIETKEDLLVLSVVWQRLRALNKDNSKSVPNYVADLTDANLFNNITPEDRTKAENIRDYYEKKFIWWALNDVNLTPFRNDLQTFIRSDGKTFKENMKPLVYRLPEFYDYDNAFDEMLFNHDCSISNSERSIVTEKTLKHVATYYRKRKSNDQFEYWFSDELNRLNVIRIPSFNTLSSLLSAAAKNPMKVRAVYQKVVKENREYYVASRYEFKL